MCRENEAPTRREDCHVHGGRVPGHSSRGHRPGLQTHHHARHPASARAATCCCGEEVPASWRQFESKEERKEKLKRYVEELKQELQGAKQRLEGL
ncbi:MAG: hypothetical protein ACLFN4_06015 [Candidatus Acetothermia bacterium]